MISHSTRRSTRAVCAAATQDRDGIRRLLRDASRRLPSIIRIFADTGYQRPRTAMIVADTAAWQLQMVRRTGPHDFVVLPKRRIVE